MRTDQRPPFAAPPVPRQPAVVPGPTWTARFSRAIMYAVVWVRRGMRVPVVKRRRVDRWNGGRAMPFGSPSRGVPDLCVPERVCGTAEGTAERGGPAVPGLSDTHRTGSRTQSR